MAIARKYLRIASGFLLLGAGIVLSLPGVPGPGILLILSALFILSGHFEWAKNLLDWMKRKFRRLHSA